MQHPVLELRRFRGLVILLGMGTCLLAPAAATAPTALPPEETSTLLLRLAEAQKASGPQRMRFEETRTHPLLVHPVAAHGTILLHPPNGFIKESEEVTLGYDGEHLWIFYKDISEIEVYSLRGSSPLTREVKTLLSGFSPHGLQRDFHVTAFPRSEGYELVFTPRRARHSSLRELRSVWSADWRILSLEMVDQEAGRTRLTLREHAPLRLTPGVFSPPVVE